MWPNPVQCESHVTFGRGIVTRESSIRAMLFRAMEWLGRLVAAAAVHCKVKRGVDPETTPLTLAAAAAAAAGKAPITTRYNPAPKTAAQCLLWGRNKITFLPLFLVLCLPDRLDCVGFFAAAVGVPLWRSKERVPRLDNPNYLWLWSGCLVFFRGGLGARESRENGDIPLGI